MPNVQVDLKSPIAGDSGRWPKLKLAPPVHTQAWDETKATMVWAVPGYTDIWLAMMIDKDHEQAWFTDQIDTAATDDKILYINPNWFFKLILDERLFVGSHEVAHAMYGHAELFYTLQKQGWILYADGVKLPVIAEMLNIAADYVINAQLVEAKIGVMPQDGLHWPEMINGDMAVLDAYRLLYSESKKNGGKCPMHTTRPGKGKPGHGNGKSFDQVLKPGQGRGKTASKAMSERSQSEWDLAVQAAMESAKARGQLPANLERLFVKRLTPKADWRDLYALAVSKKIGNDRYTWGNLEPQLIYRGIGAPGRTTYGCDLIVIVVDTSGSINERTFAVFMAETTALLEQARPKRIVFTQCDTNIQEWVELDGVSDLYECKLKQGGGTSFIEPFKRVDSEGLEPDLMVYLTDCYGDYPSKRPSYPIVWGSITPKDKMNLYGQDYTPPWGEIVYVPEQADEGSA